MASFFSDPVIEQIRRGYFSAVYFNRTKDILLSEGKLTSVTMQVFQKQESILCGIEEVRELLSIGTGYWVANPNDQIPMTNQIQNLKSEEGTWIDTSTDVKIESLKDGEAISSLQSVMHITGPYAYVAHLESIYLGILARRTLVATNIRRAVDVAGGKPVIFFADRFDYFQNQEGDGYAAKIGGAAAVCTDAQAMHFGKEAVGTIPHALIAAYGGDTVAATEAFARRYPQVNTISLVDFDNDCVGTSLAVARKLGKKLWGVRIDTALNMTDLSLQQQQSDTPLHGVNPTLVRTVRKALDQEGFTHVKIVVSGGFTAERIALFEQEKTPVDVYGIGSAMLKGNNDYTADIVLVEGTPVAKKGRLFQPLEK